MLGWPALIGEIFVGMLLGPGGINVIPYLNSVKTIGQCGLLLLVLEGGINIQLKTLVKIGWKAAAIALTGTALPVLMTWFLLPLLHGIQSKEALIAGTALSSTAIGMAAKLMSDMGLLKQYLGQLICCAAMIDDVASLILLAMISNATPQKSDDDNDDDDDETSNQDDTLLEWGPEGGVIGVLIPLLTSLSFLGFSWILASYMPSMITFLTLRINPSTSTTSTSLTTSTTVTDMSSSTSSHVIPHLSDSMMMFLLFLLAVCMTCIASIVRSTPLLGCFMAGVAFASVDGALEAWERSMPVLSTWTSRMFFASIGFAVPVSELFSLHAFSIGLFLTVIAIISKVVTGVWEYDNKWTVGWAMVGRGELGFVMAEESFKLGLTSELVFAVTVWALLLSTLISPLALRRCILITNKQLEQKAADEEDASSLSIVELNDLENSSKSSNKEVQGIRM